MAKKAVVHTRCSGCGLWVLDADCLHFGDTEYVCADCLHLEIDMQNEAAITAQVHEMLPPDEWF